MSTLFSPAVINASRSQEAPRPFPPSFHQSYEEDWDRDVACGTRRCWRFCAYLSTIVGCILVFVGMSYGSCSCAGKTICEAHSRLHRTSCISYFGGCTSSPFNEQECALSAIAKLGHTRRCFRNVFPARDNFLYPDALALPPPTCHLFFSGEGAGPVPQQLLARIRQSLVDTVGLRKAHFSQFFSLAFCF